MVTSAGVNASIGDLLATLDDAIDDGAMVSMHDETGVYTWASKKTCDVIGWQPEQLVGRDAWELIHPDDHPDTKASQWKVQSGDPTIIRYRLRRPDGTYVQVESTAWDSPDFGVVVVTKPV